MQSTMLLLVASIPMCLGTHFASQETPVSKAIELLTDMDKKIKDAGEASEATFEKRDAECKDRSKDLEFEITTSSSSINSSKAEIADESVNIAKLTRDIDEDASTVAENEANLQNATGIRESAAADFKAEEKELVEIIDTLERAIGILQKEMLTKTSFVQGLAAKPVLQAMESLVQGSVLNAADASRLSALIQSSRAGMDADDSDFGAPAAAVYESSSGGIIETLEDLLDTAQGQLLAARKAETANQHNFNMLKQSLEMDTKNTKAALKDSGERLVVSKKEKQDAESDLSEELKVLAAAEANLKAHTQECADDRKKYEAEVESRSQELAAIAEALKALREMTDGAVARTYTSGQASFLQRSQLSTAEDLAGFEVTRLVRDLARKEGTPELAQLASRVASVVQQGARAGQDPFAKVKELISGLIDKLKAEADAEATEKERCDEELAESKAKEEEKTAAVTKLTADIHRWSASSASLKEDVAARQASLSELMADQAALDKLCKEQADEYAKGKADMQLGLQGVGLALRSLRDYFARLDTQHQTSEDAATGIIGMLEVVQSDFTQNLATIEENAAKTEANCKDVTQQNEVQKVTLTQDVKYKTKESARLDKLVKDASADLESEQEQLDAVTAYLKSTEEQCADKAMAYQERKSRREREIAGLKEALSVLESETALMQQRSRRATRSLRLPSL